MAKLERIYNVPLRKGFIKSPKYKKTKKAIATLKDFLMRHMKCSEKELRIGKHLNHAVWARGYKHPPHHVKITAIKGDDGFVRAELFGIKYDEPVRSEEKEDKKKEKASDVKELEAELDKVVEKPAKEKKTVKPTDKVVEIEAENEEKKAAETKQDEPAAKKEAKPRKPRAAAKKPSAKKKPAEKAE